MSLTSGRGTLICHNNITQLQLVAIFVGQNKNEINCVTLISQHSNEIFENEKQLVNIDFKHIFGLVVRNKSRPKSNYALIITSRVKKSPHCSFQLGQSIVQVKLQRLYFC